MYFTSHFRENFTRFNGYRLLISIMTGLTMIALSLKSSTYLDNEVLINFFLFSFFSYLLLMVSLFQTASFGIFIFASLLFLGFWAKNIIHLIFEYNYLEPIGSFDSGNWNEVYAIASIGILAIIVAILLIVHLYKPSGEIKSNIALRTSVKTYMLIFVILGSAVGFYLNHGHSFLKLGMVNTLQDTTPWIIKVGTLWMMGVLIPILLYVLLDQSKKTFFMFFMFYLTLLSVALSLSISINSRATLVMLVAPLIFSILFSKIYSLKKIALLIVLWLSFLFISVQISNYNRYVHKDAKYRDLINIGPILHLAIDRWIGIEGLMSIVSYEDRGLTSFRILATEIRTKNKVDFFTKNIALPNCSKETTADISSKNFASLPGPIAFFYLSNNLLIFFSGLMFLVLILFYIELFILKISKNPFLTYMIIFTFAFEFASFGVDIIRGFRYLFSAVIFIFFLYSYLTHLEKKKLNRVEI